LIGSPIAQSLGYRLHNGMARYLRDAPVYLPFDTKDPGRLLQALRAFGPRFLGASVTSPHKQKVVPLLDELGPEAVACGAANTIVHRDGRLRGENTDVAGVRRALADALPRPQTLAGRRALVLGGGGSARAACVALQLEGARVHLAIRTRQRIRAFADERGIPLFPIAARTFEALKPEILIHATTVGMAAAGSAGDCLLLAKDIQPGSLVLDLVYDPEQTPLLERAQQAGAIPVSGLTVFLHQALAQAALVLGSDAGLPDLQDAALLLGPEGRPLRHAHGRRA
jgi:shikimate dehydrogenase